MTRPATHTTDPWSSRAAELDHAFKRYTNSAIVLRTVQDHPGSTGAEIARALPMDYILDKYEVRRRLSDLKEEGLVEHGPQRRCEVAGRLSVTWLPCMTQGTLL